MAVRKRGRTRKHSWIEFQNIESDSSPEAQYLRWASINNSAIAQCANFGCPRCKATSFRLRHDKKFDNIRFYCPHCGFETSFHIIPPKGTVGSIEIYNEQGIVIDKKIVDDYHEKTVRENADARVVMAEQKLDLGGEWFDGHSGTSAQSRYQTREEVLEKIKDRRMKRLVEAQLEDIENEERDDRVVAFEAEIHQDNSLD
jgi:ribosomal protein S27AE